MARRSARFSGAFELVVCTLVTGACGEHSSTPTTSPTECSSTPPTRPEPVAGALEIGEGGPVDFRPIADGSSEELVLGSQGGYMVTPIFRIDTTLFDTDGKCAYIDVTHTVGTLDPASYHFVLPTQPSGEPYWYIGSLPLFLSYQSTGLVGQTCSLSATFGDDGKTTSAEVHTSLVDND